MFTRILCVVLILPILTLTIGCGGDNSPSISATPNTLPPLPSTETPTPLIQQSTIPVPWGKPHAIDGIISPGEWDNAVVEPFADGSELLLMYSEGYLYLGIRANTPEMIIGNIFIDHGDEIAILHSSAALGTALYQKGINNWQQTQGFVWQCRSTDNSETSQAERDAFLEEEHWVAANARMGTPNELEYQIKMTNETLRLAANFIRASKPNEKIPWPKDLDDDCIKETPGSLPEQLYFSLDRWAIIDVTYSER